MRLRAGVKIQGDLKFHKQFAHLDEHAQNRIIAYLKRIRSGELLIMPSLIDPTVFHFYDDDYTIVIVVSHDEKTATVSALVSQNSEDL